MRVAHAERVDQGEAFAEVGVALREAGHGCVKGCDGDAALVSVGSGQTGGSSFCGASSPLSGRAATPSGRRASRR